MKLYRVIAILFGLLPFTLVAHPGHGIGDGWSLTHYTGSLEHSWILVVSVVVICAGLVKVTKKSSN